MQIVGAIYSREDAPLFTREAWCELVRQRPEFGRPPSRQVPNPFKRGEMMTIHPPGDSVEILLDGRNVGHAYWSMSDEPLVNVTIEAAALHLVAYWAEALGGEFHPIS